ncbi:phage tail protein [Anaerotignum sp.]|uniref:phage tail protein n=1 Tax=Anaerotignum sp. TaxID=2039241 RepID=UPI00289B39AC|nr:phage tail protein [Anaerotignum sp.]
MEYYVGAIAAFAFNYAPAQFVLCNGQSLLISKQQQLYALIGKKLVEMRHLLRYRIFRMRL